MDLLPYIPHASITLYSKYKLNEMPRADTGAIRDLGEEEEEEEAEDLPFGVGQQHPKNFSGDFRQIKLQVVHRMLPIFIDNVAEYLIWQWTATARQAKQKLYSSSFHPSLPPPSKPVHETIVQM